MQVAGPLGLRPGLLRGAPAPAPAPRHSHVRAHNTRSPARARTGTHGHALARTGTHWRTQTGTRTRTRTRTQVFPQKVCSSCCLLHDHGKPTAGPPSSTNKPPSRPIASLPDLVLHQQQDHITLIGSEHARARTTLLRHRLSLAEHGQWLELSCLGLGEFQTKGQQSNHSPRRTETKNVQTP